jgi:hypothetical protein
MSETEDFLALRTCLLSPLPEHGAAADMLSKAADAILDGDLDRARSLVRRADMPVLLEHTTLVMSGSDPRIQRRRPIELLAGKVAKLASRMPSGEATKALFARDGWRCRFCDCRVVPPKVRTAMRTALPGAIPWSKTEGFHGGFIAMSASVDHVVPYSAGGTNEEENLVTACWSCQFGKDAYSLEEVGLLDPRARPPVKDGWDGLGRLLTRAAPLAVVAKTVPMPAVTSVPEARDVPPPSPKPSRLSETEWFASLDASQPTLSSRLIGFVDGCSDLDVSWSLSKVLIVRMTAGGTTVELGVQRDGLVDIPWSISGRKDAFRGFAETLAAAIPGAIVYETPKLWNVSKADKRRINVSELLEAAPTLRLALERLHSELLAGQ